MAVQVLSIYHGHREAKKKHRSQEANSFNVEELLNYYISAAVLLDYCLGAW